MIRYHIRVTFTRNVFECGCADFESAMFIYRRCKHMAVKLELYLDGKLIQSEYPKG